MILFVLKSCQTIDFRDNREKLFYRNRPPASGIFLFFSFLFLILFAISGSIGAGYISKNPKIQNSKNH